MNGSEHWIEKYRPETLRDIIGHSNIKRQVVEFISEFLRFRKYEKKLELYYSNNAKDRDKLDLVELEDMQVITSDHPIFYDFSNGIRALIFMGSAGCGKTTMAKAIAEHFKLNLVMMNASDDRSEERLEAVMNSASRSSSLMQSLNGSSKKRGRLILLDEVDGLSEMGESNSVELIKKYIKITRNPVIMTANKYNSAVSSLSSVAKVIEFPSPTPDHIYRLLKRIADNESIEYTDELLRKFAENYSDYRAAVNDFQYYTQTYGKLSEENIMRNERTDKIDVSEGIRQLFQSYTIGQGREIISSIDLGSNYIDYYFNVANEAYSLLSKRSMPDIVRTLKRADKILMRILKTRNYKTLGYFFEILGSMGIFKDEHTFEKDLGKGYMWKAKNPYNNKTVRKLSKLFGLSPVEVYDFIVPILARIFEKDERIKHEVLDRCEISNSEWNTLCEQIRRSNRR